MTMNTRSAPLLVGLVLALVPGCILGNRPSMVSTGSERYGKTFYLDGAGNMGFGKDQVRLGLADGGYRGKVEHFIWTTYMGVVADQVNIWHNRWQAERLAKKIQEYIDENPGNPVNLIALSAGSGVAVFALEKLAPGYHVDNVILLSSSLSARYDLTEALRHVNGGVYFFYSRSDPILEYLVPLSGTVDRAPLGSPVAGLTGAVLPPRASKTTRDLYRMKVRNRVWRPEQEEGMVKLRHAGSVDRGVIRRLVAPIIVGSPAYGATSKLPPPPSREAQPTSSPAPNSSSGRASPSAAP